MTFYIRFPQSAELGALIELRRRAALAVEQYRELLLAHTDAIDIPASQLREGQIRVACLANAMTGFSAGVPLGAGIREPHGLFVEPAQWRHGIGRALIEDAVRIAIAGGIYHLEVTANPTSQEFFSRLGFVVSGRAETRFGPARACSTAGSSATLPGASTAFSVIEYHVPIIRFVSGTRPPARSAFAIQGYTCWAD
jgi:GNAT superfamily N-acetyltransferase